MILLTSSYSRNLICGKIVIKVNLRLLPLKLGQTFEWNIKLLQQNCAQAAKYDNFCTLNEMNLTQNYFVSYEILCIGAK